VVFSRSSLICKHWNRDGKAGWHWKRFTMRLHKKVLIAVHHPPFSLDSAHGGCPDILNAIDRAVFASKRMPDAVLSRHVHNYQRFSRKVKDPKTNKDRNIPYVIAGAGGYADQARSMHRLQKGLPEEKLPFQTTHPDVKLENFNQTEPGFLRITVDQQQILFEYFLVHSQAAPRR
jgi:hypothetical protein